MSGPSPTYVTFDTSVGSFTVELYTAHAPKVSGDNRVVCKFP